MPFEESGYLRQVLEPARLSGGVPPPDLRERYQLNESMSAAEVTATVRQVRQCWRRSRGQLKYRKLIDALEAEHGSRFSAIFQAAAEGDLGPLRAEIEQSAERAGKRLSDLRRRLDDAAGKLRLLPPDVVAGIARSVGLGEQEARRQAAELGIEIREPDQLPQAPPYAAYAKVREALDTMNQPNLAVYVFGEGAAAIKVLGPMPEVMSRVERLEQEAHSRTRGPWTVSAETVLTALRHVTDAADLVRFDVITRLRERVREHPYDDTLMRYATDELRLDEGDAKALIFAIRQESGVLGGPGSRLRELVEAGQIQAAAEFAEALPPEALADEAAELATDVRARLANAIRLRDAARAEHDPDQAWIMLEQALGRVPDLAGATAMLAGLAPHPPAGVRAAVSERAVVITWQPSASRAGEIAYEVLRDGLTCAETGRASARDENPPVNTPVTYAVVARRGQAASTPVAAPPLTLRPEPDEVRLSGSDGVVTGSWRSPAEAVRVVVTRDGRPVHADGSGFRERGLRDGATYEYVIAAVYQDGPRQVTTSGVRRSVVPAARPEPVARFTLESAPGAPGEVLIRCAEPAAGVVEFLSLAAEPRWPYETEVRLEEIRAAGRTLPARPVRGGYVVRPGDGSQFLLAVTVAGDRAVVGACREHVNLGAPQRVSAVRRGTAVLIGLEWPPDVPEIEVRWSSRRLLVSAAAYRSQGGIRLDIPEQEAPAIELVPTTVVKGTRVHGPAVPAPLASAPPVRYDLRRQGWPWRRELQVEVTSDVPARLDRLVLVIKAGRIQPASAAEGRVVGDWSAVTTPALLTVPCPRQRRPYWLRCFAEGPVELVDPPVRVLKAG
ncbi:hypothetical protein AB0K48_09865 [Nonomuraea sp. NPDC055795]